MWENVGGVSEIKVLCSAAPQSQHGSLVLSYFPQRAALDAGSELEELLQMWHLAFQPSFPGVCGFFLECVLILLDEGGAACVGNGHTQGVSAAVRPHPAQAPSQETWGDAGFVWADLISPKGLLAQGWGMWRYNLP